MMLIAALVMGFQMKGNIIAYKYNGYKLSNPDNVKIYTSTTAGAWTQTIQNYAKKWNNCSEITVKIGSLDDCNVVLNGNYTVDNGTYGVTSHISDNKHSITFYKAFATTSSINQKETVVHEMGHALGLAHCQSSKVQKSVMRATGFNEKAKPLSDDISGISNLY